MNTVRLSATMIVAMSLLCAGLLWADAEQSADLSTPKAAAKAFFKALSENNPQLAVKSSNGTADQMTQACKAFSAMEKLNDTAMAKFGPQGSGLGEKKDWAGEVDKSTEKSTGNDTAQLVNGQGVALEMKKVNGNWQVDAFSMFGPVMQHFDAMARAAQQVTADINSGKLKTAKDAEEALNAAMEKEMGSTTEPATQP